MRKLSKFKQVQGSDTEMFVRSLECSPSTKSIPSSPPHSFPQPSFQITSEWDGLLP